jgi:predicted RNA-binding protein YlxR (DUF448 family)
MVETTEEATRSCVGCRQTDARDALLRLVALPGPDGVTKVIMPDVRRRASGRGVSVHPRYRCLAGAVESGAFKRAFRAPIEASARDLANTAREQYARRAEGLVVAARRARLLVVGTEAVRQALEGEGRKVRLLVIASDAEGSREELERAAHRLGRACLVWNTKSGLGRLFSRATLSILAVLDNGIADELSSVVRSSAELAEDA